MVDLAKLKQKHRGNSGGDLPAGGWKIVPIDESMKIYDDLPPELRRLVDDFPVALDVNVAWNLWRDCGFNTAEAAYQFRANVRRLFPGYTPPARRDRR